MPQEILSRYGTAVLRVLLFTWFCLHGSWWGGVTPPSQPYRLPRVHPPGPPCLGPGPGHSGSLALPGPLRLRQCTTQAGSTHCRLPVPVLLHVSTTTTSTQAQYHI